MAASLTADDIRHLRAYLYDLRMHRAEQRRLTADRGRLIATLRDRGVPAVVIADFAGMTPVAVRQADRRHRVSVRAGNAKGLDS
ncbi:hypothetical protein NJBCHELONAE_02150 [Mycobacteroides chelonae]|nr:hypothetical protein NJBCHELONAE_02150 [Mycobacteroides chelonae]